MFPVKGWVSGWTKGASVMDASFAEVQRVAQAVSLQNSHEGGTRHARAS